MYITMKVMIGQYCSCLTDVQQMVLFCYCSRASVGRVMRAVVLKTAAVHRPSNWRFHNSTGSVACSAKKEAAKKEAAKKKETAMEKADDDKAAADDYRVQKTKKEAAKKKEAAVEKSDDDKAAADDYRVQKKAKKEAAKKKEAAVEKADDDKAAANDRSRAVNPEIKLALKGRPEKMFQIV
jgi:hypothetical protein